MEAIMEAIIATVGRGGGVRGWRNIRIRRRCQRLGWRNVRGGAEAVDAWFCVYFVLEGFPSWLRRTWILTSRAALTLLEVGSAGVYGWMEAQVVTRSAFFGTTFVWQAMWGGRDSGRSGEEAQGHHVRLAQTRWGKWRKRLD